MTDTTQNGITKSQADKAWRTLMAYYGNSDPPEDWEWESEEEKLEDAASSAAHNIIDALIERYKPEHRMLTLGIMFAQGVAHIGKDFKEEQENTLEEFVHRLRKYGGDELVIELRDLLPEEEEEVTA